jgi:hypothetical protein
MALPILNWRLLTPRTFTGPNVNEFLNLLASMGQSTTYADNSPRVPGTDQAWTWGIDNANAVQPGVTTAVYGVPPINALNMGYIIAGSTAASSPGGTYNTDSYNGNLLLLSMNKNSGTYTTWTNASPFTTGQFSGMIRASALQRVTSGTSVYWYECEEAFFIILVGPGGTGLSVLGGGAFLDPLSGAAANAETDGRLYSIMASGSASFLTASFLSANTVDTPFYSGTANGDAHFFTFNVGAVSTTRNMRRMVAMTASNTFTLASGKPVLVPYQMNFQPSGQYAGQLRSMYVSKNGTAATAWNDNGTIYGYTLAGSGTTSGETLLFQY